MTTNIFLRVFRPKEDKEILVNVNSIWKIEAQYAVKGEQGGMAVKTSLEHGLKNPDAIRFYTIFFGSESVGLPADPDDPVVKVIEQIYKDAIKG
jgi:hypothetical protein